MPRDLATRACLFKANWAPALLRSQAEQTASFTSSPQQPTPTQSPHPATLSMPHKSPTSSRGLQKDKETASIMRSSRGKTDGEQSGSAHQARVVGRGGRGAWWGEGHHSKKGVRRLLWDSRWLLLYLGRCSLSNSLFCTCKCCTIFQS